MMWRILNISPDASAGVGGRPSDGDRLHLPDMRRSPRRGRGPSRRLVAWRRFVVESLLCLVLIAMIAVAGTTRPGNVFIGTFVLSIAGAIIAIVRYER